MAPVAFGLSYPRTEGLGLDLASNPIVGAEDMQNVPDTAEEDSVEEAERPWLHLPGRLGSTHLELPVYIHSASDVLGVAASSASVDAVYLRT